jgi:hypothetical protein
MGRGVVMTCPSKPSEQGGVVRLPLYCKYEDSSLLGYRFCRSATMSLGLKVVVLGDGDSSKAHQGGVMPVNTRIPNCYSFHGLMKAHTYSKQQILLKFLHTANEGVCSTFFIGKVHLHSRFQQLSDFSAYSITNKTQQRKPAFSSSEWQTRPLISVGDLISFNLNTA